MAKVDISKKEKSMTKLAAKGDDGEREIET
jgi:hypothetical protein